MKKLAVAIVLAASTAATGACAIGPGPVVSQGRAPEGNQRPAQISSKDLERPDREREPVNLVRRFLRAAADKPETRQKTMLTYLANKSWTPLGDINIYRVFEPQRAGQSGKAADSVSVPMQRVGKLVKDGKFEPDLSARVEPVVFDVVDGPDGLLLNDAPSVLMLDDQMLNSDWYKPLPVYYWDSDGTRLVPDIRYIPTSGPLQEQAKLLIEALYAPIPDWLNKAVRPLVQPVPLRTLPVYSDRTITIDLPNQLGDDDLARLATQLDETLKIDSRVSAIQFKVQGVPVQPGRSAVTRDTGPFAARFAVVGPPGAGKVMRLDSGSPRAAFAVQLEPEINVNVDWAAFSRGEESVAISRRGGAEFFIGPSRSPWPVTMPGGKASKAVWLGGGSQAALVLSGNTLYEVVPGEKATPKPVAGLTAGSVMDFSLAPDGRIALVQDNRLHMAALVSGAEGLSVTSPRQVPTALNQVRKVALWQTNVIIAGINPEQKLVLTQVNVDGCLQGSVWKDYRDSETIEHLVADYRNGAAYYDYLGETYGVGTGGAAQIKLNEVVPIPGATPSPSAAPSAASTQAQKISAASFEG